MSTKLPPILLKLLAGARITVDISMGRTVVLGANGTGKSHIVRLLAGVCRGQGANVIYVEGGRAVTLPESIALNRRTVDQFANRELAVASHDKLALGGLTVQPGIGTARMHASFHLLRTEQEMAQKELLTRWRGYFEEKRVNPQIADPMPEELPLEKLCRLVGNVFPNLVLRYEEADGKLLCKSENGEYSAAQMSDGERQVVVLTAELMAAHCKAHTGPVVVIVDEPELNLSASLANRFWDMIEAEYEQTDFVYATHSITFAASRKPSQLILMRGIGKNPEPLGDLADLPRSDVEAFLGAVGGLVLHQKVLFVEGDGRSVDLSLYQWLTAGMGVTVVPLGGCDQVRNAARKSGPWKVLGPLSVAGVVDRDFGQHESADDGLIVLGYHEIESYLCHPDTLCFISDRLGLASHVSRETIVGHIVTKWETAMVWTAVTRTFERFTKRFAPSPTRRGKGRIDSVDAAKQLIKETVQRESQALEEGAVMAVFEEELAAAEAAAKRRSVDGILQLMPAKEVAHDLCKLIGVKDVQSLVRALCKHMQPGDVECFRGLRGRLQARLDG